MVSFVFKYFIKYKFQAILYFCIVILSGIISIFIPMITGNIVDCITKNEETILYDLIYIFIAIQIISVSLNFIKTRLYVKLQTNIAFCIISDTISHVQKADICSTENYEKGYLNQRINNDSNSLSSFVISLIGDALINILILLFSTYIIISINYFLGGILVGAGIVYMCVYISLKSKLYKVSMKLKEEQADFFSDILRQLTDIKFIKIHSLIKDYQKRMSESYKKYFSQVLKAQNLFLVYGSLDSIITILANISIFLVGGRLVLSKKLTIGTFTIVISYFNYLIQAFKYFSSLGKNYQDTRASYIRIIELLNIEEERNGDIRIKKVEKIVCKNLGFRRDNKVILDNITQEFKRGYVYGISGENGAGKSTFIDILMGLYQNSYTGEILYNSEEMKMINMEKLRSDNLSYLEQNVVLFKGSVEENILLTRNHKWNNINKVIQNRQEMEGVIEKIGKIAENKGGISGGEGQKIGIYRLLAKDADVFILDEPTASLDKKSTEFYMQQIVKCKKDKIIIIVSHDEEVLGMCDKVINL